MKYVFRAVVMTILSMPMQYENVNNNRGKNILCAQHSKILHIHKEMKILRNYQVVIMLYIK